MSLFLSLQRHLQDSAFLLILLACFYLTYKTRVVQLRKIPAMFSIFFSSLFRKKAISKKQTILPHHALMIVMSTVIGLGNISGTILAILTGGPGALLGFLLISFFGSAVTFTEVSLSMKYRSKDIQGEVVGGAMPYLSRAFHPVMAKLYAFFLMVLLTAWSGNQVNYLADIFAEYSIPHQVSGVVLSFFICFILLGGAKRLGNFSAKIVPIMLVGYLGGLAWMILLNANNIGQTGLLIVQSVCDFRSLGTGCAFGALFSALRHGIARGLQSNECGVGTATIAHSMSSTNDSTSQGILSMLSIYLDGLICFMTGFTFLITGSYVASATELHPSVLVHKMFCRYFPTIGSGVMMLSAFFLALGTILGNAYNGLYCFSSLFQKKWKAVYYILLVFCLFQGARLNLSHIIRWIDGLIIPVIFINILGIIRLIHKKPSLLKETNEGV